MANLTIDLSLSWENQDELQGLLQNVAFVAGNKPI